MVEVGLKIRNVSDHVWREVGKKDGSLWNGVTSYRYHGAEEVPVYYQFISPIPCKLAPGESAKVDLHIFAPDKPGTYRLEVVFAQTEVGHTLDPNKRSVKVERDQNERDALRYFEVEDVDTEGWIWTEWMGSVSIGKFPWIYSTRFGWLYCADRPQEAEEYWFFREDLGCFWTNPEKVPHVWSMDREKWLHAELAEQTRERFLTPEAG